MTIDPFQPEHLETLRMQGVQSAQLIEVSRHPAGYASFLKSAGPCVTVFEGDRVILCGGISRSGAIGTAWAVLSADAAGHMVYLHRAARRFMDVFELRRLEAHVVEGFTAGCRWLELLGFEFEGKMRGYGESGETHLRYAYIRM